ncbi:MAG TPA: hypothetical protein VHG71_06360 [Verrucomicrobiae bacterium]|nr:hypothetical protein [Verrucomicrobiae bacterium]
MNFKGHEPVDVASDKTSNPVSLPKRRAKKLRIIGIVILVLGIAGAGIVYGPRIRSQDLNDDISMLAFDKAESRQMGQLYGKSGQLMEDWTNDLKQPGTQAVLILIFSALTTAGCFYFARLLEIDDETPDNGQRK